MESLGTNNGGSGGGGGKRKIEDQVELAKQKAQAIAARLLSDADSKRPRTSGPDSSTPPDYSSPSFTSSHASFPVPYTTQTNQYNVPSSKKIIIPNAKVGVIIGRGGEMIKTLQLESGARIQITRDAEADPSSLTRDVELVGTQEQISRAEQRINEVIAETDATSSVSSGSRGAPPPQAGGEQFVMKVPNDKVALVIGKGGETIKTMQSKSGARIQVVPLHLPPGDFSTERNIYINGTSEQIESAKELVNEVISGNRSRVLSGTNSYQQSGYPPSSGWAPQGQPSAQQAPAYGYSQPGQYGMPPPPYYGGYPPQQNVWDQNQTAAPPQHQNTGYNAYGQAQPPSSTPSNANYNYSQMPPAAGYNYNQGYPQQPSYGDVPGQTTSSQPDGTAAVQTSQPGYGAPDGTTQTQPPSAYATGYSQAPAAPANGYSAYPSYSGAAPVQPVYNQSGYSQTGYGQQQEGQAASLASYSYYGQSGYPQSQTPSQAGYYQSGYPPVVPPPQGPPQTQPQATNGVSQTSYADGGDSTTGSGAVAEESEKPQS